MADLRQPSYYEIRRLHQGDLAAAWKWVFPRAERAGWIRNTAGPQGDTQTLAMLARPHW